MRTFQRVLMIAVIALGSVDLGPARAQQADTGPRAVPGELIVKFKASAGATDKVRVRVRIAGAALAELARTPGARARGSLELVKLPTGASLQGALAMLRSDPFVEYAEPNWIYTHNAAPNDPSFGQQWALENTGQAVGGRRGTADADIDALQAWQAAPGAPAVYVGVIDQGIDFSHPDLGVQPGGAVWTNPFDRVDGIDNDGNGYIDDTHGWDFDDGDNTVYDGSPSDISIDYHGTHVAGTLGARTGNGVGIAGVSPGVVIIPVKFLGIAGGTTANAILGVDYLTDLKVRHNLNIVATNNSWSGGGFSQGLLEAIGRAAREDILFIAAAGNGGADEIADNNDAVPTYPANYNTTALAGYDAVVAVTATGQSDELTPWGNFGLTSVDLAAPGSLVLSTTPQRTYSYSSGTSMAVPHVTGAAALVHAARGLIGRDLRDAILDGVDQVEILGGRTVTGGRLNLARAVDPGGIGGEPVKTAEIVLHASQAQTVAGDWAVVSDPTAAGGSRIQSANLGGPKIPSALANPADYFELTFQADAGRAYHLWLRGRAEKNGWANDSVHIQFDGSVDASGRAIHRIATPSATEVNVEECSGCGLSGWGWQDNGYGAGVAGPAIYFASTGPQRMRIQVREDGLGIDQIVLSSARYLSSSPGALKNDGTIVQGGGSTAPPAVDEVVLYAGDATALSGGWVRASDVTAAGGARLQNANAGAPKIVAARAAPSDYFELTFRADAGKRYRLWIRGKATANGWANDSVHAQFSDSVTVTDVPVYRIGTTSGAEVNLEDCSGCGLTGWGWQDNGYGAGVLGPEIRFAATGLHTIRIQVREDGFGIDQIALSANRYLTTAPGPLKNDSTILPRSGH